jgi:hypothetical protein
MVDDKTNCEHVWHEISNYIDGEVEAGLRAAMDEHFKSCPRCAAILAGTQNVVKLYGDERMLEVPSGFGRRLEKRLTKNVRAGAWSTWSAWLVPVAAMVLITGSLVVMNGNSSNLRSQHAPSAHGIPPDMVVVVSSGAKLFHRPGCKFIHDKASERTLTAKEAMQQGYAPCPRCLREYVQTRVEDLSEKEVVEADRHELEEGQEEVLSTTGR